MQPTLHSGQYVLGRLSSEIKNGELAIVNLSGQMLLKRVREINSASVYLEGDNEHDSLDSRDFGWLPKSAMLAKAIWY